MAFADISLGSPGSFANISLSEEAPSGAIAGIISGGGANTVSGTLKGKGQLIGLTGGSTLLSLLYSKVENISGSSAGQSAVTGYCSGKATFTITSTGDGSTTTIVRLRSSDVMYVTVDGNAHWYTNSGGTLGESTVWEVNPGASETMYLKCTSGSANMVFTDVSKLMYWASDTNTDGWLAQTNSPELGGNLNQIPITITKIKIANYCDDVVFDVTNYTALTLLHISSASNPNIYGDITDMDSLAYLRVETSGNLTGDISGKPLTYLRTIGGTCYGSVDGMALTTIYCYTTDNYWGSLSASTALSTIYATTQNAFTGTITSEALTYLNIGGTNTVSIVFTTAMVDGLSACYLSSCGITQYNSGVTWPDINVYIKPTTYYGLSSSEIDSLLTDLYNSGLTGNTIDLRGQNAPRTSASDTAYTWLAANNTLYVNSSVIWNRIGETDGTTTVSGTLSGKKLISGTIVCGGVNTVSGTLQALANIYGLISNYSQVSGTLSAKTHLQGSTGGNTSIQGVLEGTGALIGSINGSTLLSLYYLPEDALIGISAGLSVCSGTLLGKGEITGATTVSFSTSGVLSGSGRLAGSISVVASVFGNLKATGKLSGLIENVFSLSGTLLGEGKLSASTEMAFTISGSLKGGLGLAGAVNISFTNSGYISGSGVLAGHADMTASASADLNGKGKLLGYCNIIFSELADIYGKGKLSESIYFAFSTLANLKGSGKLITSEQIVFTTEALLKGTGELSGNIVTSATLSGILRGIGQLTGLTEIIFDTEGLLSFVRLLVGEANITFSTEGRIYEKPRGQTQFAFDLTGNLRIAKLHYEVISGCSYITISIEDESFITLQLQGDSLITKEIVDNSLIKEGNEQCVC